MGRVEEIRNGCGMYVGNLLGTARHGCRWRSNINIKFRKRGC